jgi:hypothetical protein
VPPSIGRAPRRRFVDGTLNAPKCGRSVVVAIIPSPDARVEHPDRRGHEITADVSVTLSVQRQHRVDQVVRRPSATWAAAPDASLRTARTGLDVPMCAHERGIAPSPENPRKSGRYNDAIARKRRLRQPRVLPGQSMSRSTVSPLRATRAQHVRVNSLRTKGFQPSMGFVSKAQRYIECVLLVRSVT